MYIIKIIKNYKHTKRNYKWLKLSAKIAKKIIQNPAHEQQRVIRRAILIINYDLTGNC